MKKSGHVSKSLQMQPYWWVLIREHIKMIFSLVHQSTPAVSPVQWLLDYCTLSRHLSKGDILRMPERRAPPTHGSKYSTSSHEAHILILRSDPTVLGAVVVAVVETLPIFSLHKIEEGK